MSVPAKPQAAPMLPTYVVAACLMPLTMPTILRYAMTHEAHLPLARVFYAEYADVQLPVIASHPTWEFLHRVGGLLYLVLGIMQFNKTLRRSYMQLHRVSGYIFSALTVVIAVSGFYFALTCPFHPNVTAASLVFGTLFIITVLKALQCIRSKPRDIQGHKEWMTRSYTIGLAVGMMRTVFLFFHYVLGLTAHEYIAFGFWLCWVGMLIGTEAWIRYSRPAPAGTVAGAKKAQ